MIKGQAALLSDEHRAVCGPVSLVQEENGPRVLPCHEGTVILPLETGQYHAELFPTDSERLWGSHPLACVQRPSLGSRERALATKL